MKQPLKNDIDILGLINKIQVQLTALDVKVDTLIHRSSSQARPTAIPPVDNTRLAVRPNDHSKERVMYTAICADCKKECKIPFKPSGDRPVYCKDCFSRRKVISMSGMTVTSTQATVNQTTDTPKPQAEKKKKAVATKKPVGKKKPAPKKK